MNLLQNVRKTLDQKAALAAGGFIAPAVVEAARPAEPIVLAELPPPPAKPVGYTQVVRRPPAVAAQPTPEDRQAAREANKQKVDDRLKRAEGLTNVRVSFAPHKGANEGVITEEEEAEEAARNHEVLQQFWGARTAFGMARIKMGAYLHLIKSHKLWRGVASSWDEFIARENVNPNAARQYMNVARKFVFDMDLPDKTLAKLSLAGMTALERAALSMNEQNQEEVIAVLSELTERDAIQRLLEMSDQENQQEKNKPGMRVLRLLTEFNSMPPDMQADFKNRLAGTDKRRAQARQADDKDLHHRYQGR